MADPFLREMFLMDENKPLPNIAADSSTPPVVLMSAGMGMGGGMAAPMGPLATMGAGFPIMGSGMPIGPMGPIGPLVPPVAQQMGPVGAGNMQLPPPQPLPQGETAVARARDSPGK